MISQRKCKTLPGSRLRNWKSPLIKIQNIFEDFFNCSSDKTEGQDDGRAFVGANGEQIRNEEQENNVTLEFGGNKSQFSIVLEIKQVFREYNLQIKRR